MSKAVSFTCIMDKDILFDAKTKRVKKFILHSNYPGHFDFPVYSRCKFNLRLEKKTSFEEPSEQDVLEPSTLDVTPYTKWEEMQDVVSVGESEGPVQPVVLNRTTSNSSDNPFGATLCYGYQDIIFEVMGSNHIAAITLFDHNYSNSEPSL